jgi:preprotein translocase subunit SecE
VADKEPAGSQDEPTPADDRVDPEIPSAADSDPVELGSEADAIEPTGAELAASGADTEGDPDAKRDDDADEREPVVVGAAASGATSDSGRTRAEAEVQGKGRATRKRDVREPAKKRTSPVSFVQESVGELRKVVYPTGQQLLNYFVVVLIFVLFIIAYVSLLDLGFGAAMFEIFA